MILQKLGGGDEEGREREGCVDWLGRESARVTNGMVRRFYPPGV
jgi:hypothetical protein